MFGRILLIFFCVIFALLLVALMIPANLRVSYEQGAFCVTLRYARRSIALYPREKSAPEQKKSSKKESAQKAEKEKRRITSEQLRYTLDVLPPVLLRALKRTGRGIRITPLKIHILVATGDPADTAILYGKIEAVLAAALPVLHQHLKIEEQDIRLFPDFCEETMDYIADVGISLRPFTLLITVLCAAGGIVKWLIGFQKRAAKPEKPPHNKTTTQANSAA